MATYQRMDERPAMPRLSSELLDRLPPQSLDAEKGVLGSLLLDPELCDEVALLLRKEDFYAGANQLLYQHLLDMHNEGVRVDSLLLLDRLKQKGDLESVGGAAYLGDVINSVPTAANAEHYARIVRDKATLRNLIHASTEILRDAYDQSFEAGDLLSQTEEKIFRILDRQGANKLLSMADVLHQAMTRIDSRMQQAGGISGLPTGLTDLDHLTGGLHPSELIILAARPSMGKSALASNIAESVSVIHNRCTLFVSLEMSGIELGDRMLCSFAHVDAKRLRDGSISNDERRKLIDKMSEMSQAPLFIDDTPSRTMTEIAATARRMKRKNDLALIVIDYLQLIEPDNMRDPRQEQVARIARRLKGLARELEVPVLCLAQLNRQAEASRDNRPRLNHLRESGAIEQDADVVLFVHREEYYLSPVERDDEQNKDKIGTAEIIIAKQRNGPVGEVKLSWFQQFTRFQNMAQKPYDEFESYGGSF
jgi:replicative DNA helicase